MKLLEKIFIYTMIVIGVIFYQIVIRLSALGMDIRGKEAAYTTCKNPRTSSKILRHKAA
ncbi:hypothetical protein [Nitratifractor sp.]|uniref:hypothetical protein n=1 Tax=Nitratifractor sp. TaxID=2268144 RepID=UPI0025F8DD95|nr:hypothetical protein [Nitratifractor sp.]